MPGIRVPSTIDNETKRSLHILYSAITKRNSADTKEIRVKDVVFADTSDGLTRNVAFKEDHAYREWLRKTEDPDAEAVRFVKGLAAQPDHAPEVDALADKLEQFSQAAAALNVNVGDALTPERLDVIRRSMDVLLGTDGTPGFSEVVDRFNKATGYQYVSSPEMKTVVNMVGRTDKVEAELSRLAAAEYNGLVTRRIGEVDNIARSVETYAGAKADLEAEIQAKVPGLTPDRLSGTLAAMSTRTARQQELVNAGEEELSTLKSTLDAQEKKLAKQREALASEEKELAATEENLEKAAADREKETGSMYKNQAEANWLKAQNAAFEDERRNNEILIRKDTEKLDALIREDIRDTFFAKRNDWLAAGALGKEAEALGTLSKEDVQRRFVPGGSELADRFIALYDKVHPESEKNGVVKFFGGAPDGKKVLAGLVTAFGKKKDGGDFGAALAGECKKLQDKLEADVKGFGQAELSIRGYNRALQKIVDSHKPQLRETIAENETAKTEYEHQSSLNGQMKGYLDRVIPALEKARENHKTEIEKLRSGIAVSEKEVRTSQERIAALEKTLADDKKLLKEQKTAVETLEELQKKATDLEEKRNDLSEDLNAYVEKHGELAVVSDDRTERIRERLNSFISRIDDNRKKGHTDSEEYKALAAALRDAAAAKPEELRAAVNKAEKCAVGYIRAKGEAKFFGRSSMGESRFNFANEIQAWCEATDRSLSVPLQAYGDTKTAENNIRRIVKAGKTDMLFPSVYTDTAAPKHASAGAKVNDGKALDGSEPGLGSFVKK